MENRAQNMTDGVMHVKNNATNDINEIKRLNPEMNDEQA